MSEIAKYRDHRIPGHWLLTDFTMEQVEGRLSDQAAELTRLRDENAKLRAELSGYHEALKFIDDDDCHASEKHCGCVAVLRAERAKLTAENGQLKRDLDIWGDACALITREKIALRQRCEVQEGLLREVLAGYDSPDHDSEWDWPDYANRIDAHLASLDKGEK